MCVYFAVDAGHRDDTRNNNNMISAARGRTYWQVEKKLHTEQVMEPVRVCVCVRAARVYVLSRAKKKRHDYFLHFSTRPHFGNQLNNKNNMIPYARILL